MPITSLPEATVNALRASQSLVDPVVVVKELLENALDAGASSVSIEISANTLDIIQCKDNGHGVPPSDRHLLAAKHCTSKMSSEQDLGRNGSSYLGFRGEALCNMAESSSELTVTTRVDGEEAGSMITFLRNGNLKTEQPRPHAVGTTVRVTKFSEYYPVRRQYALQSIKKTIAGVRDLVHSYAFARPNTRLAFSLLKTDKGRWTYAPAANGSLLDTATKILGRVVTAECQHLEVDTDAISIEAVLPKQNADVSKLHGLGEFVVLDGRPLRSSGGTGKDLIKLLRGHHGWSNLTNASMKAYFFCLSIRCQSPAYDSIVESAKDDVRFDNFDALGGVLTALLDRAYPAPRKTAQQSGSLNEGSAVAVANSNAADSVSMFMSTMAEECAPMEHSLDRATATPELDLLGTEPEAVPGKLDKTAFNPWTTAKINAPRKTRQSDPQPLLPRRSATVSTAVETPHIPHEAEQQMNIGLITPHNSSPMRNVPVHGSENRSLGERPLRSAQLYFPPSPYASPGTDPVPFSTPGPARFHDQPLMPQTLIHEPSQLPHALSLDEIPEPQPKRQRQSRIEQKPFTNKAYKRPAPKDPERDAWFDLPEIRRDDQARKCARHGNTGVYGSSPLDLRPGASIKDGTNSDIRSFLRARPQHMPELDTTTSPVAIDLTQPDHITSGLLQPIKQGPIKAARNSGYNPADQENAASPTVSKVQRRISSNRPPLEEKDINEGQDSRDLLLRPRTKSGRIRRAKSSMLPLERTPVGAHIQGLSVAVSVSLSKLGDSTGVGQDDEGFCEEDDDSLAIFCGLEHFDDGEIKDLSRRLEGVVVMRTGQEVVADLEIIVRAALIGS
ncbi:histidine kinase-like protein 5 [Elsinoe australis]|uniref:Histidine kinase-like protein 5 n=1 Tax=Elsinoe australis TaxID=40998 RepID=A0A4V6DU83_9PEZI|nr:histidine kinase-like protein 5 [Elsinoe australis]